MKNNNNLPNPLIGPNTVLSSTVLQFQRRFLNWCLHSCCTVFPHAYETETMALKLLHLFLSKSNKLRFSSSLVHLWLSVLTICWRIFLCLSVFVSSYYAPSKNLNPFLGSFMISSLNTRLDYDRVWKTTQVIRHAFYWLIQIIFINSDYVVCVFYVCYLMSMNMRKYSRLASQVWE